MTLLVSEAVAIPPSHTGLLNDALINQQICQCTFPLSCNVRSQARSPSSNARGNPSQDISDILGPYGPLSLTIGFERVHLVVLANQTPPQD